ncbi:hypothetical protein JL720_13176 [Aureococcus anophagefferens]|nr:hypothetical protein JL720_13176 [Aureococcus anophagefferens]
MMLEEPAYAYDDASERLASPDATALEPATAASFAKLERPSPQPQRHLLDVNALQHLLPGQPLGASAKHPVSDPARARRAEEEIRRMLSDDGRLRVLQRRAEHAMQMAAAARRAEEVEAPKPAAGAAAASARDAAFMEALSLTNPNDLRRLEAAYDDASAGADRLERFLHRTLRECRLEERSDRVSRADAARAATKAAKRQLLGAGTTAQELKRTLGACRGAVFPAATAAPPPAPAPSLRAEAADQRRRKPSDFGGPTVDVGDVDPRIGGLLAQSLTSLGPRSASAPLDEASQLSASLGSRPPDGLPRLQPIQAQSSKLSKKSLRRKARSAALRKQARRRTPPGRLAPLDAPTPAHVSLRAQLEESRSNCAAFEAAVKADAQWAATHCPRPERPLDPAGRALSDGTAALCRRWAAEKLAVTLARLRRQQLFRVLCRWREHAALASNAHQVARYARLVTAQRCLEICEDFVRRKTRAALTRWLYDVERQRLEEARAAALRLQRRCRVSLSKRVDGRRVEVNCGRIQSGWRCKRARARAGGASGAVLLDGEQAHRRRVEEPPVLPGRAVRGRRAPPEARGEAAERRRVRDPAPARCRNAAASAARRAREDVARKLQGLQRSRDAKAKAAEKRERRDAAKSLQKRERGRRERIKAAKLKTERRETYSASLMQRAQRGRTARRRVTKIKTDRVEGGAATLLQSRQRGHAAKKEVAKKKEEIATADAAVKVQAQLRRREGAKAVAEKRERVKNAAQHDAATTLQTRQRRRAAVVKVDQARLDKAVREAARTAAATTIQCAARRRRAAARVKAKRRGRRTASRPRPRPSASASSRRPRSASASRPSRARPRPRSSGRPTRPRPRPSAPAAAAAEEQRLAAEAEAEQRRLADAAAAETRRLADEAEAEKRRVAAEAAARPSASPPPRRRSDGSPTRSARAPRRPARRSWRGSTRRSARVEAEERARGGAARRARGPEARGVRRDQGMARRVAAKAKVAARRRAHREAQAAIFSAPPTPEDGAPAEAAAAKRKDEAFKKFQADADAKAAADAEAAASQPAKDEAKRRAEQELALGGAANERLAEEEKIRKIEAEARARVEKEMAARLKAEQETRARFEAAEQERRRGEDAGQGRRRGARSRRPCWRCSRSAPRGSRSSRRRPSRPRRRAPPPRPRPARRARRGSAAAAEPTRDEPEPARAETPTKEPTARERREQSKRAKAAAAAREKPVVPPLSFRKIEGIAKDQAERLIEERMEALNAKFAELEHREDRLRSLEASVEARLSGFEATAASRDAEAAESLSARDTQLMTVVEDQISARLEEMGARSLAIEERLDSYREEAHGASMEATAAVQTAREAKDTAREARDRAEKAASDLALVPHQAPASPSRSRTPSRSDRARSPAAGGAAAGALAGASYAADHWVQYYDDASGSDYFYNTVTGDTSWTEPPGVSVQRGDELAAAPLFEDVDEPVKLQEGESPWLEYWDESAGSRYWYNVLTHEASWTQPPEDDLDAHAQQIVVPPGPDWTAAIDNKSGRETWVNDATGEVLKSADGDAGSQASGTDRRAARRNRRASSAAKH